MFVVIAEFPIKEGMMDEFCTFMKGPFGVIVTRSSKGCRLIKCFTKDNIFGAYEEWLSEADQQAYLAMRGEPGHAGYENGACADSCNAYQLPPVGYICAQHPCNTRHWIELSPEFNSNADTAIRRVPLQRAGREGRCTRLWPRP